MGRTNQHRWGSIGKCVAGLMAVLLGACSSGGSSQEGVSLPADSRAETTAAATPAPDASAGEMPELAAALLATGLAEPTMWVASPDGRGVSFVAPSYAASSTDPTAVAWEYLTTFADAYGVAEPQERFEVVSVTPTAVGTIVRFEQSLDGLPLYGGGFTVTVGGSTVTAVTGAVLADAELPEALLDANQALGAVLGTEPGWSSKPAAVRAVAYSPELSGDSGPTIPAWEFELVGNDWTDGELVVVSALDGARLVGEPLVLSAESWDVYDSSGATFDRSAATRVITVRGNDTTTEDDASAEATVGDQNMRRTWEYFASAHGRDGNDDAGGNCALYVHAAPVRGAAVYSGGTEACRMVFGTYGDSSTAEALDVVAHEYTHGLVAHTAGLKYRSQSGALNEHYADFFAVMIDTSDWLLTAGSATVRDITVARDMTHLVGEGEPPSADNDYGGVHANSAIPNYAAFLVADEIGRDLTAQVWYPTLLSLSPNTTFAQWACATIATAYALPNDGGSADVAAAAVVDAMLAVGLVTRTAGSATRPAECHMDLASSGGGSADGPGGPSTSDSPTDPDESSTTAPAADDGAFGDCFVGEWELDSRDFVEQIVAIAGSELPPGARVAHTNGRYLVIIRPDGVFEDHRTDWTIEISMPELTAWTIFDGVETGTWAIEHDGDPRHGSLRVESTGGGITVRIESSLGALPVGFGGVPAEAVGSEGTYECSPSTLEVTSVSDGYTFVARFTRLES